MSFSKEVTFKMKPKEKAGVRLRGKSIIRSREHMKRSLGMKGQKQR